MKEVIGKLADDLLTIVVYAIIILIVALTFLGKFGVIQEVEISNDLSLGLLMAIAFKIFSDKR